MLIEQVTDILKRNRDNLDNFHIKSIYLFGSVVRDEKKDPNDIDLLVEFEPDAKIGLFEFARIQRALSGLLGCNVDLVTPEALHKALKERIMEEAVHAI
jgi:uncharacterized protein